MGRPLLVEVAVLSTLCGTEPIPDIAVGLGLSGHRSSMETMFRSP